MSAKKTKSDKDLMFDVIIDYIASHVQCCPYIATDMECNKIKPRGGCGVTTEGGKLKCWEKYFHMKFEGAKYDRDKKKGEES